MSEPQKPNTKPVQVGRKILGPGGNRAVQPTTTEPAKPNKKQPIQALPLRREKMLPDSAAVRKNVSVDSSCSSDSSSSTSSGVKTPPSSGRREKIVASRVKVVKSVKKALVEPESDGPAVKNGILSRCDWITANSDPLYISFHDQEWGVPVHDDNKLFELLCLSIALAEHSWLSILCHKEVFRKLFDEFNLASVASFSEEKLLSVITYSRSLLSEPKIRAFVDNAKQILQIQKQYGSFSNYCWRFVNNKPVKNGFRYQRQVPVKTPKAELISKDLMRRGFRCVGPTVVYSFMQVAGIVNDHLTTCFRYEECNSNKKNNKAKAEDTQVLAKDLEGVHVSDG